jgi:hypothetical protein
MLAIPNYARMNRLGQAGAEDTAAGNPAINYAPGATVSAAATNATTPQSGASKRRRGGSEGAESVVWVKAE